MVDDIASPTKENYLVVIVANVTPTKCQTWDDTMKDNDCAYDEKNSEWLAEFLYDSLTTRFAISLSLSSVTS